MRNLFTWAGLLAIFLAGCVTGGVAVGAFGKHKIDEALRGDKKAFERTVLSHLVKKLDLDEPTRESIKPIVEDTAKEYRALRRKYAPEIDAIIDRNVVRLKEKLDPERSQKLDEMLKKIRSKRAALLQDAPSKDKLP